MQHRKTIVTQSHLAVRTLQLEAARAGRQGVLVTTMPHLVSRLAGGFARPVDGDDLREVLGRSLRSADLGELNAIADLPGLTSAVARTLQRAWLADVDLQARQTEHPRLRALAGIEENVLRELPTGMLPQPQLVKRAIERLGHAVAITGPVEVRGITVVAPAYQRLLLELAEHVPVTWHAPAELQPTWLKNSVITLVTPPSHEPKLRASSAGTAFSEVQEAMRWVRELLAAGVDAGEIGLAAASTDEYDTHFLAARASANIDVHLAHGLPVTVTRPGQEAAALADVLVRGLSQNRMRRLNNHLSKNGPLFHELPQGWVGVMPKDAPLDNPAAWERLLNQLRPESWPDEQDHTPTLRQIVELLQRGTKAAAETGEALLPADALKVWRKALVRGPASAINHTLSNLKVKDTGEATSSVAWMPASTLQAAPRKYVRLLGLNSSRWPRNGGEDALLPDHVIPSRELAPLTVAQQDRLTFQAIIESTEREIVLSWSRRGAEGRRLARSALVPGHLPVERTYRHDMPAHAFSESDRLLARPDEFAQTRHAQAAQGTWLAWLNPLLTAHDGLISPDHPVIMRSLNRLQSATSLRRLLRHPAAFVWQYGLGMRAPSAGRSQLQLDHLEYGSLVHEIVEHTIQNLAVTGGLLAADSEQIDAAVRQATSLVSNAWLSTRATPPRQLWERQIDEARRGITTILEAQIGSFGPGVSYAEVPFGGYKLNTAQPAPWDTETAVTIPGTNLRLRGFIDHMNVSMDGRHVQVIDYKTGRTPRKPAEFAVDGGRELQRSIYAYAVKALMGDDVDVQASLTYVQSGEVLPIADPNAMLQTVTTYLTAAVDSLRAGAAVPGIDAEPDYDDMRLAMPAYRAHYLELKNEALVELLPRHNELWSLP